MEVKIETYVPVTRRKSLHRLTYPDHPEPSFHQRLDRAIDEAWSRGCRIIIIETETARFFVEVVRKEAVKR